MRTRSRGVTVRAAWTAALAMTVVAGCAATLPAPAWLPDRADVDTNPFGAFAVVTIREGNRDTRTVTGELIAVETDSTYLLTEDPATGFVAIGNESISSFAVRDHAPPGGEHLYSETALTRGVGSYALERMQRHARFPQGLPDDLDRRTLRSPWAQQGQ